MNKSIKISIVTAWYNEELLAPLFLMHYDYVDEINIILDSATNDNTLQILEKDNRVKIFEVSYLPDGLDWEMKQENVNMIYLQVDADWVFVVDADEFIFKKDEHLRYFLSKQKCDIFWVKLYQVYRHITDLDLDYSKPPLLQRIHGSPIEPKGKGRQYLPNRAYLKPIVVRAGLNPLWDCGCHNYFNLSLKEGDEILDGAHWHMADPVIALRRRIQTKKRQSFKNIVKRLGFQNHFITEEEIIRECKEHENDPVVITIEKQS